jgi:cytochrome c oxidase assembly factor CtaG
VRAAALVAGAAALVVALGPLDGPADTRLSAHMAQHLLLVTVAPALLALGAPVRMALARLPRGGRRRVGRALRSRPAHLLARLPVALGLCAATLVAFHLPPLFGAALAHPAVHGLEHALLFWTALLVWVIVLGVDPVPRRAGAIAALAGLVALMIPMAAVGATYLGAGHVLFAHYAAGGVADQRSAGTLMWLGGMAVLVPAAVAVAGRALWREEQRQRRREALS